MKNSYFTDTFSDSASITVKYGNDATPTEFVIAILCSVMPIHNGKLSGSSLTVYLLEDYSPILMSPESAASTGWAAIINP